MSKLNYQHQNLSQGGWFKLTLLEQMANLGSEVLRTIAWQEKDNQNYADLAFWRAQELLELTLKDPKNIHRGKEVARVQESLTDWYLKLGNFHTQKEQWQKYFWQFNLAVRLKA